MDARSIDARDETWEVRAPKYRVYFFDRTASDEFELDAHDVVEALTWAESNRGQRTFALYACAPVNGMGLVLLAGADPKDAADPDATDSNALASVAFASTLVRNLPADPVAVGQVGTEPPDPDDVPQPAGRTDVLTRALAPVLHDVRTTGAPEPGLDRYGWVDDPSVASAMLGGGTGLIVVVDVPEANRIAAAADQVLEWVIEELWGSATTNWPPCPHHRASHPLRSVVLDGLATWICPNDGDPIGPVGALPAPE